MFVSKQTNKHTNIEQKQTFRLDPESGMLGPNSTVHQDHGHGRSSRTLQLGGSAEKIGNSFFRPWRIANRNEQEKIVILGFSGSIFLYVGFLYGGSVPLKCRHDRTITTNFVPLCVTSLYCF